MSDATAAETAGETTEDHVDGSTDTPKTFTQDDVDKIVADRLKREKTKTDKAAQDAAEKARVSTLGDQERAIEEAKAAGRNEARKGYAKDLAAASLKAELTGLVDDPDQVIEDLNLDRFLTENGEVDKDAVKALRTKYQNLVGKPRKSAASPGRSNERTVASSPKEIFGDFLNSF